MLPGTPGTPSGRPSRSRWHCKASQSASLQMAPVGRERVGWCLPHPDQLQLSLIFFTTGSGILFKALCQLSQIYTLLIHNLKVHAINNVNNGKSPPHNTAQLLQCRKAHQLTHRTFLSDQCSSLFKVMTAMIMMTMKVVIMMTISTLLFPQPKQ